MRRIDKMGVLTSKYTNKDNRTPKEQVDHIVDTNYEELTYMSFIDFIGEKVWIVYCNSEYNRVTNFKGSIEEYDSISRIMDLVNWDAANPEIKNERS